MQEREALIDIFDDQGQNIGHKFRQDINYHIDIVKQVNVVVLDDKGRVCITKAREGIWAGKWGTSAAGLVRHDEALMDAAKRTLKRELGLDIDLKGTRENLYNFDGIKKYVSVFYGTTKKQPEPTQEDFEEAKWVTFEEANTMIKNDECMPTLSIALEIVQEAMK